ncbi:protein FYV4, mitochondrial [Acrasis kona]|uniref:Small ribosomal subunit protein mS41 n=1 Tax=Acrasis kona TaxID=1008807 RepID=A0AAW2Z0D9_9EUKA
MLRRPLHQTLRHTTHIPLIRTPSTQIRTFYQTSVLREEEEGEAEEEDIEVKKQRLISKINKPVLNPFLIPRRRRGITHESFLDLIGKNCGEHKDKIKSWEQLFTFKTKQLKKLEISCQQRKWILGWVQKYRQGYTPGMGTHKTPKLKE